MMKSRSDWLTSEVIIIALYARTGRWCDSARLIGKLRPVVVDAAKCERAKHTGEEGCPCFGCK